MSASGRTGAFFLLSTTLLSPTVFAAMPDLIVNWPLLHRSPEVINRYFAPDACEVIEGCVGAPGIRKLLLFDVGIANAGRADVVLGDPNERPDIFEMSPCHDHMHLQGFAVYKLHRRNGQL